MNRVRIYHRAQRVLPPAIETSGLACFVMSPGQLECLLSGRLLRCASHGTVVLALSDPAATAIQRDGLAYFDGATRSRGVLSARGPAHYEAWRAAPLPDAGGCREDASGLWPGFVRADVGPGIHRRLCRAWRKGAYCSRDTRGGAWLGVLPSERLVVYRWWD